MSADNWTKCPRCYKKAEDKAALVYGKVSREEYERIRRAVPEDGPEETLREDYEIGIYDGMFEVTYSGYCAECGFEFNFEHKTPVLTK